MSERDGNLDRLVALQVMGWRVGTMNTGLYYANDPGAPYGGHYTISGWRPSCDISLAWEVVKRMAVLMGECKCNAYWWNWWHAAISIDESGPHLVVTDPAALPAAICRAALKAVSA